MVFLMLLFRSLFLKVFPKRVICLAWLVILARFVVPWGLGVPIETPIDSAMFGACLRTEETEALSNEDKASYLNDAAWVDAGKGNYSAQANDGLFAFSEGVHASVEKTGPSVSADQVGSCLLFVVWPLGSLVCSAYFAALNLALRRRYKNAVDVLDGRARKWLLSRSLRRKVRLVASPLVAGPMTYGILCPTIVVPVDFDWSDWQAARLALEHEYAHVLRLDVLKKAFALLVACAYWFDPLVWIGIALYGRDLELACDEVVARRCSPGGKRAYARLILDCAQCNVAGHHGLTATLAASSLEERIISIMAIGKGTSVGQWVCAVLGAVLLICAALFGPKLVAAQGMHETVDPIESGQIERDALDASNGVVGDSPVGVDASSSKDHVNERLAVRRSHNDFDSDLVEYWTPCYVVSMREDVLARSYEWSMNEGELYEQVKEYATDVLSLHAKNSNEILAAVFCANADVQWRVEQAFPSYDVMAANGKDESLRVYVVNQPSTSEEGADEVVDSLFDVSCPGLNGEILGLRGFDKGSPDVYGAIAETTGPELIIRSPEWTISIPHDLVNDSILTEDGERLFYTCAGQNDCVRNALRLPLSDGTVVEVYCASSNDAVWSDYLGEKVKVDPVGIYNDSVVMVGVYTLEDLESEMTQPADSDGLEALWQRAASWVSNPV